MEKYRLIYSRGSLVFFVFYFLLITIFSCNNEKAQDISDKLKLCADDTKSNNKKSIINVKMDSIIATTNSMVSIYENGERANMIGAIINNNSDIRMIFNYAKELLNDGQTESAIEQVLFAFDKFKSLKTLDDNSRVIHEFLAVCYLRKGEQENCQNNHTDQSCIVPIVGTGLHELKSGSLKAIDKYIEILKVYPDDYQSRWLLNVAYMTLNRYPTDVPLDYLVKIGKLDDSNNWKNVGKFTGLDHFDLSGSPIIEDFDNDGYLDLIVSSWGHKGIIKYYKNQGSLGFIDQTQAAGLSQTKGGLNLKQGDFNNDGFMDFLVMRGTWRSNLDWGILPNSLMRNNGDGTFTDVTISSGMYSVNPSSSVEWIDFDSDGFLDLFIANETTGMSKRDFPCELFYNNGDGTFTDIAEKHGVNKVGFFKGVNMDDINNDGHMDLFVSNLRGDNLLLLNVEKNGERTFQDIAKKAGVILPKAAFPCWFFDINNDGWSDIFVSSFDESAYKDQSGQVVRDFLGIDITAEKPKVYINNKDNTFEDVTDKYLKYNALSAMGCNREDIDNDGYKDFYLGTGAPDFRSIVPNRMFKNVAGNSFEDITFNIGVGHIQKGHGISFADIDNDGDVDVYAVMGGAFSGDIFPNALFENPGNKNKWLKLQLEGTLSNRNALGAKINVEVVNSDGTNRNIFHKIGSGGSFGCNPLVANIGLGNAKRIAKLSIVWPNGKNDMINYFDFELNKSYLIIEGKVAELREITPFKLIKSTMSKEEHNH